MNYSTEQSAIFDWFKSGTGNRRAGNEIEEANVKYVAYTRAKETLFLVA